MRSKTILLCITAMLQGLVHQSLCWKFYGDRTSKMDSMSEEIGSSFSNSWDMPPSYTVSRDVATREIPVRQSVTESSHQLKEAIQGAAKGGLVDVITTATVITNTQSSLSKSFVDLVQEQLANVEKVCKRKFQLITDALNATTAGQIALMDGITDLGSWSIVTGKSVAKNVGSGIVKASKKIAKVPGKISTFLRGS